MLATMSPQAASASARHGGAGAPVYITGVGAFLPGAPVGNDEMEAYLGRLPAARRRSAGARCAGMASAGATTRSPPMGRGCTPMRRCAPTPCAWRWTPPA